MSKVMLVNVTHVEESRVAVLEDGVLAGYEIETLNRTSLKGNIYNAVVESTHPSLEAAFVRIDGDRKGFLPLDEVNFKLLPARGERGKGGKIGQHVKAGQKLMVQVVREPFAGKPPTISTYFSLPGRYLVLMPGVDSSGVSRKIEDTSQRDRLKSMVDELNAPEGFGVIVRTAGMGQTKAELQRDLRYLLRLWESIQRSSADHPFPGLVYREADLVIRTIRDYFTTDISEVWIDSPETFDKACAFVKSVMPSKTKTIKFYEGDRPLFNKFNLEEQIEKIYKRRVPLPAGGEIVIDGTEALTAIDVNTARSKKQGDLEEIALKTNVEAAAEIARQLRLRDLGGLIVIDFIDLNQARNRKKVEKAMKDAMKGDRARYDITSLSKLGLMELARQRLKGAKMAASYATCEVCDGYGLVKNVETSALAALRKLQTRSTRGGVGSIKVALPPDVATWLLNNKREELLRIERTQQLVVEIEPRPTMLRHESDFTSLAREKPLETLPAVPDVPAEPPPASVPRPTEEKAEAGEPREEAREEAPKRRRSRRRRSKPVADAQTRRDDGDRRADGEQRPESGRDDGPQPAAGQPREESPKREEPAGAETAPRTSDSEFDGKPPRRRRRRRRRGKASATAGGNGADSEPAEPRDEKPPVHVRADELMPAASGSLQRREGRQNRSGGRRHSRPR